MKKVFFILVIGIIVIGLSGYFFIHFNSQPVKSNSTSQNFVINQGDGLKSISLRLQENNYIRNHFVFYVFVLQKSD